MECQQPNSMRKEDRQWARDHQFTDVESFTSQMVCMGPIGIMIRINQLLKDLFETTGENEYGGDIR